MFQYKFMYEQAISIYITCVQMITKHITFSVLINL